jgi:tetratricopeptide (TPR) repeat protein
MKYRQAVVALFLLLLPCALAQFARYGNVKVRVTYRNDRATTVRAKDQLMSSASNNPLAEGFTNDQGMVEFLKVGVGNYHVLVTGGDIEDTDSGVFEVDERKSTQFLLVPVRRIEEANSTATSKTPTVAAADLNIPQNARKEFDKASDLIVKQEWKKAIEHLNRALQIYPKYPEAYNNLGVAYSRLRDRVHEREALQKAIELNDHFAVALVNLARMEIAAGDFPSAETYLNKATAADPNNVQTLTLLANVQLLDKHYDDAIASMRKVHAMPHETYALVHYIAARAFEHENRPLDAISEFQTFLKEEPSGAKAEAVRKEMAVLESQTHQGSLN